VVLLARESVVHCLYSHGRLSAAARWDSSTGFYAFEQGAEAESQGRLEDSRSAYLAAAARAPDVIPVAAQAGSALADAELWGRAMPLLERAAALDYYFTLAHFYLGQARLHAGDRAGAVEAFATSFLVRPATVFADVWLDSPEREVYGEALERAIDRLYDLAAFSPPDAPRRRFDELATFLVARRNRLPEGPYRLVLFDWLDRDPEVNHSLIVFRRDAPPKRVTPVALLSPTSALQPPAGLGAIRGLPSVRAIDLLKAAGRK
jgi:tetratricopeptide (TPR) repeat protein